MGLYIYAVFFLVSLLASTIGSICGMGGGVIIKPVLDMFGILNVSVISFLSGCTVLSMTCYSIGKAKLERKLLVDLKTGTPLAIGAAIGGVAGKNMFRSISAMFADQNRVGAVQAGCLLVVTAATLAYTLNKKRIRTQKIENVFFCILIGMILGVMSSFLGIGGGPINLVVFYYFFSMDTKTAAQSSLYVILFSQITSLMSSLITKNIPDFSITLLLIMILAGVFGGICGRTINKRIDEKVVEKLFVGAMMLIICINIYNVYQFI